MIASAFDEENYVLDKPKSLTVDQCIPLSVWRGLLENGMPVVISCWKPTKDELESIILTGRVWLMVLGEIMPPVILEGRSPFGKDNL